MLSFANIALHSVIMTDLIMCSLGLDNTEFGKDKGVRLPFIRTNSSVLTAEFEANADDAHILLDVCPNNYCDGAKSNKLKRGPAEQDTATECCIKCECGDDCFELGNCCYDKTQLPGHTREHKTEICTQASIISSHSKAMPAPVSYMLYQSCSDTDDASLVSKCNVADAGNMDEFVPVYSATTGRNYRNKYCAECNKDVGELVAWDSDVHCENYMDFMLLFDLRTLQGISLTNWLHSEYIHCAFYLSPPRNSSPTQCLHHLDMIDRCDVLSLLFYSFGDKCMTYYSPIYTKHHIFKNVFCLMCNEFLQPLEEIECDASRHHGRNDYTVPIMRLLMFWDNSPSAFSYGTTKRSEGCRPPLVFNEDINTCINIICPMVTLPAGHKCYPVFKSLTNVNLDFRVIVKLPSSNGYDPGAVLDEVWTLFEDQYDTRDVCTSKIIKITAVESRFKVVVQTIITVSQQTDIKETFDIFVNNIDRYGKDSSSLFKMEVAKTAVLPTTDTSVTLQFDDDYDESNVAIAMTDLVFCHTVEISNFDLFGNKTLLTNDLIFYPGEYAEVGFDKVRVCLDKYLLKHRINRRQNNQSNGFGSRLVNLYYVLILSLLAYATSNLYT